MEEQSTNNTTESKPVEPVPAPAPVPTPAPAPMPAAAPAPAAQAAAMGTQGLNGPMPQELNHWSWAAFLMNWLWGISHNVWIALLMFVPFVNFFVWIYLGIKGNELAWEHRKFESVEQFKEVQKKWTYWGIGIIIAQFLLMFMMWSFIFAFIVGGMAGSSSSSNDYFNSTDSGQFE